MPRKELKNNNTKKNFLKGDLRAAKIPWVDHLWIGGYCKFELRISKYLVTLIQREFLKHVLNTAKVFIHDTKMNIIMGKTLSWGTWTYIQKKDYHSKNKWYETCYQWYINR